MQNREKALGIEAFCAIEPCRFVPVLRERCRNKRKREHTHSTVTFADVHAAWMEWGLEILQRDDGLFQIGLADDAPGPFETRAFAADVLARTEMTAA